jgi:hypothetical protein
MFWTPLDCGRQVSESSVGLQDIQDFQDIQKYFWTFSVGLQDYLDFQR